MTEQEMRLELFRKEQERREKEWKETQARIFERVNRTSKENVPQAIEKLESRISEEYRQKEKSKEYDRFDCAQEHQGNIELLEYEIRALNRKIGIQSFDFDVDFECEGKTWVVCSHDEGGYYCQAYPKEQEDREYRDREQSGFKTVKGVIVKL